MENKREHPRVQASRIVLRVSTNERLRHLYLRDLSLGGLFVKSDKRLPLGTALTVELWPPEWKQPLVFEATVIRWQEQEGDNPQGMGMKFGPLAPEVQDRLAKLIEEHSKLVPEQEEFVERRIKDLIGDLDTARHHIVQLEKLLEQERAQRAEVEQDEADVRKLADKLATEKTTLERRSKEEQAAATKLIEEGKSDRQRLDKELERLKAELRSAQDAAKKDAKASAVAAEDLRRALAEQSAEAALHRQRADSLADEVEKRRTKERDLRKLLAAIGASTPKEDGKDAAKPEADDPDDSLTIEEGSKPSEPAKKSAEDDESWEESIDIAASESGDSDEDFTAFQQRLKDSTRLVPADKLRNRKAKGDAEKLVVELLQAGPTLQTLLNQVGAKVPEATLHRLLFDLHSSDMLELRG